MSNTIDQAFVKQYTANIFHLSQQKGSRLRAAVRNETQKGEVEFFERLGSTTAVRKASRHGDTPLVNSQHSRRACFMNDYEWADLIDKEDRVRTLIDPTNPYVQSAMMALGRTIDEEIIAAALGSSYGGKEGTTAVPLPAGQFIGAVNYGSPAALSDLNVKTLIKVKSLFGINEVDPSIKLHIAVSQKQIDALLNETQVTSSDFAAIKALVQGEVNEFMGFTFHRTQLLPNTGGAYTINTSTGAVTLSTGNGDSARRCFAWAEDGIVFSVGADMRGKITERADKSYSTQVYAAGTWGAVRLEEAKVVGILCTEA